MVRYSIALEGIGGLSSTSFRSSPSPPRERGPAHAHEKWFVEEPAGRLRWDLLFRRLPLVLIGAVLLVTLLGGRKPQVLL